tara:strand:- start:492 stop:875 length:384 start_codon:yes stop_codon:yes gene_type:complete
MIHSTTADRLRERLGTRRKRFLKWLSKNPDVWIEFVSLSLEAIGSGRKHYSAWLIAAVIRHQHDIKSSDGEFKISNERIGWLARLFHHKYPQHKGFYETRPMKEERLLTEMRSRSNVVPLYLTPREG